MKSTKFIGTLLFLFVLSIGFTFAQSKTEAVKASQTKVTVEQPNKAPCPYSVAKTAEQGKPACSSKASAKAKASCASKTAAKTSCASKTAAKTSCCASKTAAKTSAKASCASKTAAKTSCCAKGAKASAKASCSGSKNKVKASTQKVPTNSLATPAVKTSATSNK